MLQLYYNTSQLPYYLKGLEILIQHYTVPVAIGKSIPDAPRIFRDGLIEMINKIKPKFSLISVGKNNLYHHPNKSVLENLKNTKIYRTDQDGSVILKMKNNKLQIETYAP